jgi:hypothetical protein
MQEQSHLQIRRTEIVEQLTRRGCWQLVARLDLDYDTTVNDHVDR